MSVARNTSYNLIASLVPMGVSFFTVPVYISILGQTRYGIMAIFALLLGYFGVFDLGLSSAIAHRLAGADENNLAERRKILWTGISINAFIGLMGSLAVLPVANWYFTTQIKVSPAVRPEVLSAAPWLALAVPVMLLTSVLRGALQGAGQFRNMNVITATGGVFTQLATLVVAWVRPDLSIVLPVMFLTRIIMLLALAFSVKANVLRSWRPMIDRSRIADLFSFGGWIAISSLISSLMTTIDRFIIGSTTGAQSISYYSVPYQIGERALIIPSALSSAIFPKLARSSEVDVKIIALKSLNAVAAVMVPAFTVAVSFLQIFLSLYISKSFAAEATIPGRFLFAGFCINCFGLCFYVCLQGGGKPKLVAVTHLIEILPFIVCLILALRGWGIVGAAVVFTARITADSLLLAHFSDLLAEYSRLLLVTVLILGAAIFGAELRNSSTGYGLMVGALAIVASFGLAWQRLRREKISPMGVFSQMFPRPRWGAN